MDAQGVHHDVQMFIDVMGVGGGAQLGIGHNERVSLPPALIWPPHGQHCACLCACCASKQARRIRDAQALHSKLDLACSQVMEIQQSLELESKARTVAASLNFSVLNDARGIAKSIQHSILKE